MKANAPEKIYIDDPTGEFDDHWSRYYNNDSIEYTRTDAFIEKACEWLNDFCNEHYIMPYSDSHEVETKELMEIFIKKMEE